MRRIMSTSLFSSLSPFSPCRVRPFSSLTRSAHVDYYALLGVTRDTPASEFKAEYYKRAKQYHPDSTIHYEPVAREWAARRFKLLAQAYSVLSDPAKRQHYDTHLDLTAVGDTDRIKHWVAINRPPDQIGVWGFK